MSVLRSVAALVTLLGGLVAIPFALLRLSTEMAPALGAVTDPAELLARLLAPDDGSLLAGLLLVAGWAAWAVFAVSVLLEVLNLVSRGRWRIRLPGLGGPQRLVAGLLLAVVAVGAVQGGAHADASPARPGPSRSPSAAAPVVPASTVTRTTKQAPSSDRASELVHVVVAGDDLWSLADHYYGQGQQWRRIAAANPKQLSGGPDRLQVGSRLVVPGVRPVRPGTVTVAAGDTLSSMARTAYGDASAWPRILQANPGKIVDPDLIEVGLRLDLPVPAAERSAADDERAPAPSQQRDRPAQGDHARDHAGDDAGDRAQSDPSPAEQAPSKPAPAPEKPRPAPSATSTGAEPTRAATAGAVPTPTTPGQPSERPGGAGSDTGPVDGSSTDGSSTDSRAGVASDRHVLGVAAGVGGLLAAGLGAAALGRRRQQLAARPVGRRIPHPRPATQAVEAAVGRREARLGRETLDLALRAVGAHARATGRLPELELVRLSPSAIELELVVADARPPAGFLAQGRSWRLDRTGGDQLRARPELADQACPYPLLVTLGTQPGEPGPEILVDLERVGLLTVAGVDPAVAEAVELALGTELALCPWAEEVTVTVLGRHRALVESFDRPEVRHSADVEALLNRLERRRELRRGHLTGSTAALLRLDPDLAASWAAEVVLVATELTPDQRARLVALATEYPRTALAVVLPEVGRPGPDGSGPGATLRLGTGDRQQWSAHLDPYDLTIDAQRLLPPVVDALADLLATTASTSTTPAPWWNGSDDAATTDNTVTVATSSADEREDTTAAPVARRAWASEEDPAVVRLRVPPAGPDDQPVPVHHPTVLLLGPVGLVGARGGEPTRAAKQCVEYCTWLLEHPGSTAPAMAAALAVAEGTRRSNMSRLRGWLGDNDAGDPYLPDAYSGRILLDPAVSSDWQRLQLHTAGGVDATSTEGLVTALELVRGAPLSDAAPGQWHWAEELRTDMASVIRDIGVVLAERALAEQDLQRARWAANRALTAVPGDERLLGLRLQTEHLAGNRPEVERLAFGIAAQARTLGVDLDPETVTLLQQVLEGRPRARVG